MASKFKDFIGQAVFVCTLLRDTADYVREPLLKKRQLKKAACKNDGREILRLIKRFPKLLNEPLPVYDMPPLHYAATRGMTDFMNGILVLKPDLNARTKEGCTALFLAPDAATAERLITAGVPIEATDHDGNTALLHCAGTLTADKTLPVLLRHKANAHHINTLEQTSLMCAAIAGTPAAFSLLLAEGVDPAREDLCGMTALGYAQNRNTESRPLEEQKFKEAICGLLEERLTEIFNHEMRKTREQVTGGLTPDQARAIENAEAVHIRAHKRKVSL